MPIVLTRVRRYPVKSCRGEDLQVGEVEPWGLAGDRRLMLVDDDGVVVTAREFPPLVLVTPLIDDGVVQFQASDRDDLTIPVPDSAHHALVEIWQSKLDVALADSAAHAWFSDLLGVSVRLVYLADPTQREPNPARSAPGDRVSLADSYPLLLTTEDSLAALNALMGVPLPMTRFRPNVVVSGAAPWAEDGWRRVRIGAVDFRVVKGCDRCVLTTIDLDTAAKGQEPIATLARHRSWDGKVWFGVNLIPDRRGVIRPGDPVEILEQVDTSEPLR